MNASDLIAMARASGITLWVEGGNRLRYRAKTAQIPPELRGLLAANRDSVIAVLLGSQSARTGTSPPSPPSPPTQRRGEMQPQVLVVLDSSDPAAIGGMWIGNKWHPPTFSQTTEADNEA